MKQRAKKIMAMALSLAMCVSVLPAPNVLAAPAPIFTEEQNVIVSKYGEERSTLINDGWKFSLGSSSAAWSPDFNDSGWENVDLPHDFSISQPFTPSGEAESGFLPGGTGWYRKKFTLPESCAGKSIVLNFDGVYSHATVYVNGTKVGEHHYGYTSFAFDITDYLKCDGASENVIAVEAVNNIPSSRWYSGSGIYRDVKLMITDPVHVALNGTYVTTPELKKSQGTNGTVNVKVDVQNDSSAAANVTVRNTVYKKDGMAKAASAEATAQVAAGAVQTVESVPVVDAPQLWTMDDPQLYVVRTEIVKDGKTVDTYDTEFGFKWYEFVDNVGFKLNGKNEKINGVCMHHDQGALGSAAYTDAMRRQLEILKNMGVNTIRATHNPYDEDFVDLCNEMGLLVIEEAFDGWSMPKNGNRNDFSTHFKTRLTADNQIIDGDPSMTWAEFAIKSMVKRDRNDASIILWSLCNEVTEGSGDDGTYPQISEDLIRWVKEVDTTHPVTSGDNRRSTGGVTGEIGRNIYNAGGVVGYNYGDINTMNSLHQTYPVMLWSESASATTSRGIYVSQASNTNVDEKMHLTSYDTSCVGWGKTAHASIWNVMRNDYIAGECVWTGFDYIGEPTPWNGTGSGDGGRGSVPNSSYFGIIDTAGFPKDTYYLYRSQWNQDAKTLHLVTAWDSRNMMNSNGKTPVWVYSNAAKVELFRDGTKIGTAVGTKNTTEAGHTYYTYTTESHDTGVCTTTSGTGDTSLYAVFNVDYKAGTISAKAYDETGKEITDTCEGTNSVSTPGAVSKLKIEQNETEIQADGSSLTYISVDVQDAAGNLDTTAENDIRFTLEGNGEILGVDNGDQATVDKFQQKSVLESATSAHIKAFSGKALAIVRSTKDAGSFTVNVSSAGLTGGEVTVTTTPKEGAGNNAITSYRMSKHCYVPAGTSSVTLPATLKATYADGTEKSLPVSWKAYNTANLQKPGLFNIDGTISAGTENISVFVTVHVYNPIASAKNYSAITQPNFMPDLPKTAMTYYADGTAFEEFPVSWNLAGITESNFAKVGTIVKINGTVTALGNSYPVQASIRVAEPIPGEKENIAPVASKLEESCKPTADNLRSIIDEKYYSADAGARWTNWNDETGQNPTITMAWDTAHMVNEIRVFYYTKANGLVMPDGITFKYSLDGTNFTEIGYAEPVKADEAEGYSYALNEAINPIAIQLVLATNGKKTGLCEVEVIGTSYTYESNTSASLDGISIGGKGLPNFNPDVTEYEVDSLDAITASNTKNASVTVLPQSSNSVKILVTSEDGKTTKTYTLSLKRASAAERAEANAKLTAVKSIDGSKYTPESFAKLQSAIAELEKNLDIATSGQLKAYLAAIASAEAGLVAKPGDNPKPPTPPASSLKKGQTTDAGKVRYQVIDAAGKKVAVMKGLNKKETKVTIPSTVKVNGISCKVTKVSANAFKGYSKLNSVTIGKYVTSIEKNAFNGCKKLSKTVFKGTDVKTIKSGAFKKTSAKMSVTVPKNLKKNKKAMTAFKKKLTKAGMSKKLKLK